MLSQVKEKYSAPYKFDYYWGPGNKVFDVEKPTAQDHWGYFNNTGNTTLVPELEYTDGRILEGGNRNSNPDYSYASPKTVPKAKTPSSRDRVKRINWRGNQRHAQILRSEPGTEATTGTSVNHLVRIPINPAGMIQ